MYATPYFIIYYLFFVTVDFDLLDDVFLFIPFTFETSVPFSTLSPLHIDMELLHINVVT